MSRRTKTIITWVVVGILAWFFLPMGLRIFAKDLKGEYDPKVREQEQTQFNHTVKSKDAEIARLKATLIDPAKCEFVLVPKRDATFLRCAVPKGTRIPNWPDKTAPLNK